jgi:uncharacterized glyoxalase superfamily protein PhnB
MPTKPPGDLARITPHLFYDDVAAAMDWIVEAFGFVVRVRMTDDDGHVVHGELGFEESQVMIGLASEHAQWESPNTLGGKISQRLFIYVDDVDSHHERSLEAGADVLYPPAEQFYGDRVYECVDPEGHHWKFAEHLRDVDLTTTKRPD